MSPVIAIALIGIGATMREGAEVAAAVGTSQTAPDSAYPL